MHKRKYVEKPKPTSSSLKLLEFRSSMPKINVKALFEILISRSRVIKLFRNSKKLRWCCKNFIVFLLQKLFMGKFITDRTAFLSYVHGGIESLFFMIICSTVHCETLSVWLVYFFVTDLKWFNCQLTNLTFNSFLKIITSKTWTLFWKSKAQFSSKTVLTTAQSVYDDITPFFACCRQSLEGVISTNKNIHWLYSLLQKLVGNSKTYENKITLSVSKRISSWLLVQ